MIIWDQKLRIPWTLVLCGWSFPDNSMIHGLKMFMSNTKALHLGADCNKRTIQMTNS